VPRVEVEPRRTRRSGGWHESDIAPRVRATFNASNRLLSAEPPPARHVLRWIRPARLPGPEASRLCCQFYTQGRATGRPSVARGSLQACHRERRVRDRVVQLGHQMLEVPLPGNSSPSHVSGVTPRATRSPRSRGARCTGLFEHMAIGLDGSRHQEALEVSDGDEVAHCERPDTRSRAFERGRAFGGGRGAKPRTSRLRGPRKMRV